jgi:NAD(P)-dependent dehydrogenase (short-subunit alcohol dehydrogenase family)
VTAETANDIGPRPRRLQDRLALITGASRGIGRAVAVRFAQEGARLILVARTQGALEETDDLVRQAGAEATLVVLDLADHDKIDQMAAAVAERFGRLDVLVGNAAILGTLSPMSHTEPKDFERVMRINVGANFRLIRAFDAMLRLSPSGRAIFVTSSAGDGQHPYWGAYATSKGALDTMVKTWAGELAKTNLRVNLINPGATRTRMRGDAFPAENPDKLKTPDDVTEAFVALAEASSTRHGETITVANK